MSFIKEMKQLANTRKRSLDRIRAERGFGRAFHLIEKEIKEAAMCGRTGTVVTLYNDDLPPVDRTVLRTIRAKFAGAKMSFLEGPATLSVIINF